MFIIFKEEKRSKKTHETNNEEKDEMVDEK